MNATTAWLTVLIAGAGCYLLRISMVALLDGRQPSGTTIRLAAYVMPAAFAALAAGGLLQADGDGNGATGGVTVVVGASVTMFVAVRTRRSNLALIAGLATAGFVTAIGAI